ncbi:MAG: exostosin family protein [Ferruginibacter sp.]
MFTAEEISRIQHVPFIFRMPDNHLYPVSNWPDFECWLYQNIKPNEIVVDRVYLPIFFTSFYKGQCNYGNNKVAISVLQNFLNSLDSSKKYFTIVQFDNGILNDISHLDIKVFSMAGGRKDYGLPLICQEHKIKFEEKRDIFASFVGRITHPIREEMINLYSNKKDYFISTKNHSLPDYCRILSRSVFSLSPRGYSCTSFRLQESLEYGSIPVYISDEFYPVHDLDFNDYCVVIPSDEIKNMDKILRSYSKEQIEEKTEKGKYVFENYYTFEANRKLILANL